MTIIGFILVFVGTFVFLDGDDPGFWIGVLGAALIFWGGV